VAVASAFIGATATSEIADVEIRNAAEQIVANSASSAFNLSTIRSSLRRFEVLLDDYVDLDPIVAVKRSDIVQLRNDILPTWAAYQLLPTYKSERDLWTHIDDRLRGLDVTIADCLDAVAAGKTRTAIEILDKQVKPMVDALDNELAAVVELNRSQG